MLRIVRVVIGCAMIGVGVALTVLGYQKAQPTTLEKATDYLDDLAKDFTGEPLPNDLRPDNPPKTEAYLCLAGGVLLIIAGCGTLIGAGAGRPPQPSPPGKRLSSDGLAA